ncbi:hypothetical protein EI77_03258 [Prosthecobacter fusiformis]|uniref:Uncharacterized protein n=1 Tax=Prosthecobacter fusiformis TaxID=48464 RepID=A0A4R7RRF7_9BACT|nr:hypothetical protein [Prosthecobacter fusiformis]TDU68141.1 hypothetical protein EI77_03258 [Prosthecobacter fusiformis]
MSGAFRTPDNKPDAREREKERNIAEYHEAIAESSYRWATAILILGLVVIATPQLDVSAWNWYIVGVVALVMIVFSIRMMMHGRVGNSLICLFCALAVLPGWVLIAPDAVKAGHDFYEMIVKQWKDKLG